MSAALPIFVSCNKRYATKNTTFMYHDMHYTLIDATFKTHKREIKEAERIISIYDDIIISNTKLGIEKLNDIKEKNMDYYFNINDALKFGVVDEIL